MTYFSSFGGGSPKHHIHPLLLSNFRTHCGSTAQKVSPDLRINLHNKIGVKVEVLSMHIENVPCINITEVQPQCRWRRRQIKFSATRRESRPSCRPYFDLVCLQLHDDTPHLALVCACNWLFAQRTPVLATEARPEIPKELRRNRRGCRETVRRYKLEGT